MGRRGYDRTEAREAARREIEQALPAAPRGPAGDPESVERWAYAVVATRGPFGSVRDGLAALRKADPAAADGAERALRRLWARFQGAGTFLGDDESVR